MEKIKRYREVKCSEGLPKDTMDKFIYMVEFDVLMVGAYDGNEWIVEGFDNPKVAVWLEPYELPTEGEIEVEVWQICSNLNDNYIGTDAGAVQIAEAITNLLKGE